MAPDQIEQELDELKRRVERLEARGHYQPWQYRPPQSSPGNFCQRCGHHALGPCSMVRGEYLCPSHALQAVNNP